MTAQDQPWTWLRHATCGLLLITTLGCCRIPHTKVPPPPPICESKQQDGTGQLTGSASTTVGKKQFIANFTRSIAVSPNGAISASQSHLLVQRRCQRFGSSAVSLVTSLEINTQESPNGALQLMGQFGQGFLGVKNIVLTSSDRVNLQGSVNGRALAPFPITADPNSIKFADGSAVPPTVADDDTKRALPILLQAIQAQCPQKTVPTSPVAQLTAKRVSGADPPAHPPSFSMAPCITCTTAAGGVDFACMVGVAGGCVASLFGYPICVGIGIAGCNAAYLFALSSGCHLYPIGGQGSPCCPVLCSTGCCGPGENCAGPGTNPLAPTLCCSSPLTGCGQNCCTASETCVGGGTCCPTASVCGSSCCSAGQTCLANGTCCNAANVCGGQNCCNTGDTCLSNGTCCPAGRAVCNGVCCPEFNICDPTTNSCIPSCPGGCPANQICCIEVHPSGARDAKCFFDLSRPGLPWCESVLPNNDPQDIFCRTCPQGKSCAPICSPNLCSNDDFCQ